MNKENKGFTLVELIGVIALLAILTLLTFPSIVSIVKRSNSKIDSATSALIVGGAKNMVEENKNSYPLTNGKVYCSTIKALMDKGYVITDLENGNGQKIDTSKFVKISVNNNKYEYEIVDSCTPVAGIDEDTVIVVDTPIPSLEFSGPDPQSIDLNSHNKEVTYNLEYINDKDSTINTNKLKICIQEGADITCQNSFTNISLNLDNSTKPKKITLTINGNYVNGTKMFLKAESGYIKNDQTSNREVTSAEFEIKGIDTTEEGTKTPQVSITGGVNEVYTSSETSWTYTVKYNNNVDDATAQNKISVQVEESSGTKYDILSNSLPGKIKLTIGDEKEAQDSNIYSRTITLNYSGGNVGDKIFLRVKEGFVTINTVTNEQVDSDATNVVLSKSDNIYNGRGGETCVGKKVAFCNSACTAGTTCVASDIASDDGIRCDVYLSDVQTSTESFHVLNDDGEYLTLFADKVKGQSFYKETDSATNIHDKPEKILNELQKLSNEATGLLEFKYSMNDDGRYITNRCGNSLDDNSSSRYSAGYSVELSSRMRLPKASDFWKLMSCKQLGGNYVVDNTSFPKWAIAETGKNYWTSSYYTGFAGDCSTESESYCSTLYYRHLVGVSKKDGSGDAPFGMLDQGNFNVAYYIRPVIMIKKTDVCFDGNMGN